MHTTMHLPILSKSIVDQGTQTHHRLSTIGHIGRGLWDCMRSLSLFFEDEYFAFKVRLASPVLILTPVIGPGSSG